MAEYIAPIQRLVEEFRRLPGVGAKTAARYAFAVLDLDDDSAVRFSEAIIGAKRDVHRCPICFSLSTSPVACDICADEVMGRVRGYRGTYHVLGGALSPIDNITPADLTVKELVERVEDGGVAEIIIATNPTPGGDTTAAYLARILEPYEVKVSRLAYGIPVGGDIEYADEVTLYRAMEGRRYF